MKFSANISLLWPTLPICDAIHLAKEQGYDAVECHFPYATPAQDIANALTQTGLPLISLNTRAGDLSKGECGFQAVPTKKAEARAALDEAVDYAKTVGAKNIHLMCGAAQGEEAQHTLLENIAYADSLVAEETIGLLLEPKNHRSFAGYAVPTVELAAKLVERAATPRLGIMFDLFHVQIQQGDVLTRFRKHKHLIKHVQFANVPDRHEPRTGEIDILWLLRTFETEGYGGYFGAEFIPTTPQATRPGWT